MSEPQRPEPERDPWRCPLPDSGGAHVTYGGLCHCGWSRNQPERPGRARHPDLIALIEDLAAIEAEAAHRLSALETAAAALIEAVLDRPFADPDDDAAKAARALRRLLVTP